MNKKIMLIDDEKGVVTVMKSYFEILGYEVVAAYSGKEALRKINCQPDIILLDINMPDIDGFSVCQNIREHVMCPILFLTARIETTDKIKGFSVGGDDYIIKPFDFDELGARVAAHIRRENRKKEKCFFCYFDDMVIDYTKREISIKGMDISLSKKEFDIVELLSTNGGQIFGREQIYESIWGIEGVGNSDTIMEHVRKIRAKFSVHTLHNYIETVWGVGYKWIG